MAGGEVASLPRRAGRCGPGEGGPSRIRARGRGRGRVSRAWCECRRGVMLMAVGRAARAGGQAERRYAAARLGGARQGGARDELQKDPKDQLRQGQTRGRRGQRQKSAQACGTPAQLLPLRLCEEHREGAVRVRADEPRRTRPSCGPGELPRLPSACRIAFPPSPVLQRPPQQLNPSGPSPEDRQEAETRLSKIRLIAATNLAAASAPPAPAA